MQRRDLIKQTALTLAAFTLSRDLFAAEAEHFVQLPDVVKPIKLSSNENPHGPCSASRKAMMDAVNGSNRYPWDVTTKLREEIGALTGHTKEHIVIGAGSSELLGLTAVWAALQKGNAIAPDPTFRLWMPAARKTGLEIKLVPLTEKKETDLQRMKEAMNAQTRMVYICNPGNPTGTIIPAAELEALIKEVAPKAIILLDEAYTEFSNEPSMAHLVNDYPNLVIAKTFSKIYGMAGARVGYVLAHPATVKQLNELQPWANAGASAVSLAGALAAIKDKAFLDYCKKENAAAKAIFYNTLDKLNIPYIQSHTSFVYFNTANFGKDFKAILEAKNIVGARTFEEGTKWLRLSIGTQEEMKKVAAALLS